VLLNHVFPIPAVVLTSGKSEIILLESEVNKLRLINGVKNLKAKPIAASGSMVRLTGSPGKSNLVARLEINGQTAKVAVQPGRPAGSAI
jgi:hypothetical protein